ncbi:MAG: hypothetical protein ABI383_10390 [Acidobacteriaceae bacterium]
MAERVKRLGLEREHDNFLYFLDGEGNVCGRQKGGSSDAEVVVKDHYLYFIDNDGEAGRSKRRCGGRRAA